MTLIKTSILSAVATAIRVVAGFITNKIVSVYIGPSGIALVGQFTNFTSITMALSNGGVTAGVIKYTAEYLDDEPRRNKIQSTAISIALVCSFLISICIIALRNYLSVYLLKSADYSSIFLIFGCTLTLFSLNSILLSLLNGFKEIKKYVFINICINIVGLILTSTLVIFFKIYGALLSMAISQSVVFFITLTLSAKSKWFKLANFLHGYDKDTLINLLKFSLMAIVSAFVTPTAQLLVRNHIVTHVSIDAAGYWQGVLRISEAYLMIITFALSTHVFPRLSEIKKEDEVRKEIFDVYKFVLPIVAVLAALIFLLKSQIIHLLYSNSFLAMKELFAFQLLGDFLRISNWILLLLLLAKARVRLYIICEITFSSLFVLLGLTFVSKFGVIGVTYAYVLTYLSYLMTTLFIFRNTLFFKQSSEP